ncbi:MAG: gliding motility-associated C-terminal domain-containing protein, partial [Bacteroidia bacterium]|nr:gliding motility-associated C-terminal domain-containing protein [Bacteroidia bacterium]
AVVSWVEPTATDNCTAAGSLVWTKSHTPGSVFPVGTTTVTYTARDAALNISNICSFIIAVNDNELPSTTCPTDITQNADIGFSTATVVVPDASINDNCSVSALTWVMTGATTEISPTSGINQVGTYTFNTGVTMVTCTITDAADNVSTCSFNVTITPSSSPLSGSITSQINVSCFGTPTGSVTVSGSEGVTPYEYKLDAGSYQSSGTFGALAAGTYTVTVRDAVLNVFDVSIIITQPASPVGGSITSQTDVLCFGSNTGSVTIGGSGGTSPYQYKLGAGYYQGSGTFGTLTTGSYTVTVQDANLCTFDVPVTITQPALAFTGSITTQNNVLCFGSTDGSVTLTGVGGTTLYQYSLNGGPYQLSGTFTGLTVGTHDVTVIDANLCTTSVPFTITEPSIIAIDPVVTNATCPDEPDGSITLTITGGTHPYNVIWSDGTSTQNRTGLTAATYSLVATDINGCSFPFDVTVGFTGSDNCLVIPQIITPNNDGYNDTWVIKNIDLFPNAEVKVFNRWGKLVFRTKNISANPWDGVFKGEPLPTDSYHYVLDLNDGSEPRSGAISVTYFF